MEDPVEYSTSDYQSSLILMNKILGHPTVKSNQALNSDPIDLLIAGGSIQLLLIMRYIAILLFIPQKALRFLRYN